MLKNYLLTAYRNLLRNKTYAAINIVGLAVGTAACMLIFIVLRFETSFDTFHKNSHRIYRVSSVFNSPTGKSYSPGSPAPVADALRIEYPQLEMVAMIRGGRDRIISVPETGSNIPSKKFKEEIGVFFAEPQFFQIFSFTWLAGDAKTALTEPNTCVLTKETAERYFGDWKTAVGKTVLQDNRRLIKITGILDNVPPFSDFPLKLVTSFATLRSSGGYSGDDWVSVSSNHHCYVVLPEGLLPASFNASLATFVKKHKPPEYVKDNLLLQPLSEVHFDDRFGNFSGRTFSHELINVLTLIGVFLIVIACVNFINLATAQAVYRAREVGVRKVMGSSRHQLIVQFLGETALISFAAIVVAVSIAFFTLPALSLLLNVPLHFPINGNFLVFLLLVFLSVTIVSGFYPAMVLSGFNPINALKSNTAPRFIGGLSLRRALVVLQFFVAQVLIIGTLVVVKQMQYCQNASLGFDKEAIIRVALVNDSTSVTKFNALRQRLVAEPGIQNLSFSFATPANDGGWYSDFKFNGSLKNTDFGANLKWADTAYSSLYNLQFVAGRNYRQSDTTEEVVVNETLVQKLGFSNPKDILGKKLNFWDGKKVVPVVGVIKDFHAVSFREPIQPVVMGCWKNLYQNIAIKLRPESRSSTLAAIENAWTQAFPAFIYEYQFLDERIANFYQQESQLSALYKIFAAIAIFISCLGLYGLVSFMAVQRIREVGIRKVLGASVQNIVYLFSKEFTVLIGVAFLIATPVAYYFMNQWLANFTYRIPLNYELFMLTIALSVFIALLTVGYKAVKAAVANPIKSLRTE